MPNPLTGDFDALVQVSVKTLNRLLATMHQNHGNEVGMPSLPHRMETRVGDDSPPGVRATLRGTAYLQIGTPTVALTPQSSRDGELSCWIRTRYRRDPGTAALPEFIHGKIVARLHVEPETIGGIPSLRATASPEDAHITFTESGLPSGDVAKVTGLIRQFLRNRVDAVLELSPDLPPGVADLRALTDGQGRQAVALPVALKGAPPATAALGQVFLEGSDFAIAVSREFILSLIQPHLDALKASQETFSVTVKYWGTAHYTVTITKAAATWIGDGRIGVSIAGHAKTPAWWAPNVSFGVGQDLKLVVHFPAFGGGPVASVVPLGVPSVSADASGPLAGIAESRARNEVRARFVQARETALAQAQPLIDQALAKTQLLPELLGEIDDGAKVKYQSVTPDPDGVVLRGSVELSPRKGPQVTFAELGDGSGYTAFESWVPGGRIKNFSWSWWRNGDIDPATGGPKVHHANLADRYVLQEEMLPIIPAPPPEGGGTTGVVTPGWPGDVLATEPTVAYDPDLGVGAPVWGQACLTIFGEYIHPQTGQIQSTWAQAVIDPGLECVFASWLPGLVWEKFPEKPPKLGGDPPPLDLGLNILVFVLAEEEALAEGEALRGALRQMGRPDAGLALVLAARMGRTGPSRTLAAHAEGLQRAFPRIATVLADREGEWLSALDLPANDGEAALRLVDATGRVVWRHDGGAGASAVSEALRAHLVPSPPPRGHLLRMTVRAGDRAPDFRFEITPGQRVSLRRLRGRRLALLFVSEEEATLKALLERLSTHAETMDGERMLVIVVGGGRSGTTEGAQGPFRFDLATVSDPESAIARRYGIDTRPTAVLVDRDSRVSTVQMMSSRTMAGDLTVERQ